MDGGTTHQPQTPWKFSDDATATYDPMAPQAIQTPADQGSDAAVEWTASEFIAHHKTSRWYGGLLLATLAVAALIYLITGEFISALVILVLGALVGYTANRQPAVLPYRLDARGLTIGTRFYPYNAFKSFYVVDEGAFSSITMMPTGGFMPEVSIYYAPEDEPNILDILGLHLPMENNQGTLVDHFARRLRF